MGPVIVFLTDGEYDKEAHELMKKISDKDELITINDRTINSTSK